MKNLKIIGFGALFLALIGATIFGAIKLTNHQAKSTGPAACPANGSVHTVIIKQATVTPSHTTAPRCDRLTIVNEDNIDRLMAFGLHEHHTPYDGTTEKLLLQGQSLTVTLNQAGNFRFHDHLHDEVQGTFTVTSH